MELALHLLPRRALALDGGSSILKGGPVLLEMSFHLRACTPLLAELLLHLNERRHLLLQGSAQLLGLLSLLLCLSLPRLRPSRVVRSCWSWVCASARAVSLYASVVCASAKASRAFCSLPFAVANAVVWTSLGPLPRWVPGPTTRWAPGTTRLALHGT
jgi:hypothetical protein